MMDRLNSLFVRAITRVHREERGQALTEYALVLGVIVVGVIVSMTALKTGIASKISSVVTSIGNNGTTAP
jgi:Flp pilus assembly pilin Flp